MDKHAVWMSVCGCLVVAHATAQTTSEAPVGRAVERHLSADEPSMPWVHDPALLETDAGDRFEVRPVAYEALETVKLRNVVPPIRFESGVADIPASHVEQLREALARVRGRRNVRLHLVGHADDQPLSPALERIYGDNSGLSRERAGEVAEFLQRALRLPPESISYEWAGDTTPIASNATEAGRALNRRVEVEVWFDEPKAALGAQEVLVAEDFKRVKVCRMQTLCKMRFKEGHSRRARVKNLVPPLHYEHENTAPSAAFIEHIRKALRNLEDKQNVVVRFIGYTDGLPLTGRNERIYGDHVSLSKARAHRVALAVREALQLTSAMVASDGRGATQPLAPDNTAQGRALNRRIEVQFWHDDPLQEMPEEPQLCPEDAGTEIVTKVYEPAWGGIAALQLANGQPIVPAGYTETLRRAMADVADRTNVRLRFVGYTANERLDRRTAAVYGDDIGLSAARARRAMDTIREQMQLARAQAEHEGRGYVHSNDVVNAGFTQDETSYVVVQVVYDEPAVLDDYEGVDITRIARELKPRNPFGLNLMHITVDGVPIDDPDRSSADVQRCTDVALDKADIQFQFDNLKSRPRLSVAASPSAVMFARSEHDDELVAQPVRFRMYTNYRHFIERAEVRIFEPRRSPASEPVAVLPVGPGGLAEWEPEAAWFGAGERELKYVLRAYGRDGKFDDTGTQPLWLVYAEPGGEVELEHPDNKRHRELLAGYGESELAVQNIQLSSGTVTVRGAGIPAEHTVLVGGRPVPLDSNGNFIAEEILPTGLHTFEVAVLGHDGNGTLFLRELEFEPEDRFRVGIADLTFSTSKTNGPADLLRGANAPETSSADGRFAFYLTEKFGDHWRLTASADTREGPLEHLFSNFLDKSPEALFRRIDPDNHYATFGDDGVVEEVAPTLGKFFVKVNRDENHALWGNFKVSYHDNELAQVDRGLYGGNARWQSEAATFFGEERAALDVFAADSGTVAGRDEFRGTGGSLYFLRNQDILAGSERVRIEVRDKDSGLVTGAVKLRAVLDYDIDYLQGRILLAEPLSSTASDSQLVRSGGLSGDEAYLVVRYEFTPGLEDIDTLTTGGQGHWWVNDYIKLGLTASSNEEGASDSGLRGADLTLRKSADSWFKVQTAQSTGLVTSSLTSDDGGFGFAGIDDLAFTDASADGYRADLSVELADFVSRGKARLTLYTQTLDAGYSAAGLATLSDLQHSGGTLRVPLGRLTLGAKADRKVQELGLEATAQELDVGYQLGEKWSLSTGVRKDERRDGSPIVPLTQEQGERTDAIVHLGFDSLSDWRAYAFAQDTLSKTESREDNGRVGVGGSYRFGERVRMDMEVSDGDVGTGGKLGTRYLFSNHTNLYLNYALENERTDNGLRSRRGNLISGVKRRLSDSSSVYFEERYQDTDFMSGLTHATGVNLAAGDRWNMGANAEIGTLQDSQTGAKTERNAGGLRVAYGSDNVQVSSGIEYLFDQSEQPDATWAERTTWLFRNNFKYQMTRDWRVLGKLNHSLSESSLGQFYDGGYTEAVIGYGYRPALHDRLNALIKYTYFYNVPTTDQITLQDIAAQFIQKSHIASVDVTYDITPAWSIGAKYAHRVGQLSLERADPQFFDNPAQLMVLRADWRFRQHWEGLIEARVLELPDFDERRSGALVGIYRNLGEHVKLGVGYNFTDFADDLTDLSYDNQGAFINVVGAM